MYIQESKDGPSVKMQRSIFPQDLRPKLHDILHTDIETFLWTTKIPRRFNLRYVTDSSGNQVKTVEDLVRLSAKEILRTPNLGPTSLKQLKETLSEYNLSLQMNEFEISQWRESND